MKILIQNIRLIDVKNALDKTVSILIENGIIKKISPTIINDDQAKIINGEGLYCTLGMFDMHTDLSNLKLNEKNLRSESESALNGGFTGFNILPNTDPIIDDFRSFDHIKRITESFDPLISLSGTLSIGRKGKILSPFKQLRRSGVFMFTDYPETIQDNSYLKRVLDYTRNTSVLIAEKCRDSHLSDNYSMNEGELSHKLGLKGFPNISEEIMVSRNLILAKEYPEIIFHFTNISTSASIDLIREAKSKYKNISCSVSINNLYLTQDNLISYDTFFKVDPPLRTEKDRRSLIAGLLDDTIDVINSGHKPVGISNKELEFSLADFGSIGFETFLGLLIDLSGKENLDLGRLLNKVTINPRRLLSIKTDSFEEGSNVDLMIFDPTKEWKVNSSKFKTNYRNTPYNGFELKGKLLYTMIVDKFIEVDL